MGMQEGMNMKNGYNQNLKNESSINKAFPNPKIGKIDPDMRPGDVVDECKCADREAEKAKLRELNDRHLLLLSEKQGVINCLIQKMESLTQLKEVFIDEERDKLKKDIDFLGKKIKDSERQEEQSKKTQALQDEKIVDLKRENAILVSAKEADDEKMEWLAKERDHDRENFKAFTKKVFTEKWEEILEKVERRCDGKSYLEAIENKLAELRHTFDDRSAFDEMESKYKEQIEALHANLVIEKENAANTEGDNSEMKCKIDILQNQLEDIKKENEQIKDQL